MITRSFCRVFILLCIFAATTQKPLEGMKLNHSGSGQSSPSAPFWSMLFYAPISTGVYIGTQQLAKIVIDKAYYLNEFEAYVAKNFPLIAACVPLKALFRKNAQIILTNFLERGFLAQTLVSTPDNKMYKGAWELGTKIPHGYDMNYAIWQAESLLPASSQETLSAAHYSGVISTLPSDTGIDIPLALGSPLDSFAEELIPKSEYSSKNTNPSFTERIKNFLSPAGIKGFVYWSMAYAFGKLAKQITDETKPLVRGLWALPSREDDRSITISNIYRLGETRGKDMPWKEGLSASEVICAIISINSFMILATIFEQAFWKEVQDPVTLPGKLLAVDEKDPAYEFLQKMYKAGTKATQVERGWESVGKAIGFEKIGSYALPLTVASIAPSFSPFFPIKERHDHHHVAPHVQVTVPVPEPVSNASAPSVIFYPITTHNESQEKSEL